MTSEKWNSTLSAVRAHLRTHGAMPRRKDSDPEVQALAIWVKRQRQRETAGRLSIMRAFALDDSGILWRRGNAPDSHAHLATLAAFANEFGRLPVPGDYVLGDPVFASWWGRVSASEDLPAPLAELLQRWGGKPQAAELLEDFSILESIDAGRHGDALGGFAWYVDWHLQPHPPEPSPEQVHEFAAHFGRQPNLHLRYPIARSGAFLNRHDRTWVTKALELAAFKARTGRYPRTVGNRTEYRKQAVLTGDAGALSDEVIALRHWLNHQRQLDVRAQLSEDRALFLDAVLPHWRNRTRRRTFPEKLREMHRFVRTHGGWPSQSSKAGADERHLASLLNWWRTEAGRGSLDPHRVQALVDVFGREWRDGRTPPALVDTPALDAAVQRLESSGSSSSASSSASVTTRTRTG